MFVVITVIGLHRSQGRSVPRRLSVTRTEPGAPRSQPSTCWHSRVSNGSRPRVTEGQDTLCSPAPLNRPQLHQADVTRFVSQSPPPLLGRFPLKRGINCTSAAGSSLCQNDSGVGSTAAPSCQEEPRCLAHHWVPGLAVPWDKPGHWLYFSRNKPVFRQDLAEEV